MLPQHLQVFSAISVPDVAIVIGSVIVCPCDLSYLSLILLTNPLSACFRITLALNVKKRPFDR